MTRRYGSPLHLRARLRARKLQNGYRHLAHLIIEHKATQHPT